MTNAQKRGHRAQAAAITKHGMSHASEYRAYHAAKTRCENPNDQRYNDYGGRGVRFLFTGFEQFFALLGPRPRGKSLDRIDNDGHYKPGNVRWATRKEQYASRRIWNWRTRRELHPGERFGRWRTLTASFIRKQKHCVNVQCSCGLSAIRQVRELVEGKSKGCRLCFLRHDLWNKRRHRAVEKAMGV